MRTQCAFLILAVAVISCVTSVAQTADSVYFVTQHDRFDVASGAIEDFSVKNNITWKRLKEKLSALAHGKGANVVFLKTLGNETTRHVKGTLYRAEAPQLQAMLSARASDDATCAIIIFRNNGPSLAVFKYDVAINDKAFNDFNDMSFIRKRLPACDAVAEVQVNRFKQKIPLKGRTRYFCLVKNAQIAMAGNIIFYSFGPAYSLLEVEDEEQARMLCAPLKQYMAQ